MNWGHKAFQASALPTELSRHAKWTQQKFGFLCQIKNSSKILFLISISLFTFTIRYSVFDIGYLSFSSNMCYCFLLFVIACLGVVPKIGTKRGSLQIAYIYILENQYELIKLEIFCSILLFSTSLKNEALNELPASCIISSFESSRAFWILKKFSFK